MIEGPGGPATIEENDILFLPPADARLPTALRPAEAAGRSPPGKVAFRRTITPDPVLLFRHSVLTINAHRIHYDRDYAAAQGEPGLLVPGMLIVRFSFRAAAPVHDTAPFAVAGAPGTHPGTRALWAIRADDRIAMTAEAGFETP